MTLTDSKRLAKNTLFMYIRMGVAMLVAFFTSRIVLNQLGEVGYGLYNIVAGVIIIFSFISNTLASSYSRFLSYAIGENDITKTSNVFSTILFINIGLCVIVLLLSESLGLWYVLNVLRYPENLKSTVLFIYHTSIFTVCGSILAIPFTSMIIAQEAMKIYAYLSLVDVFFKLGIALSLSFIAYKLEYYATMQCVVSFLLLSMYYIYCKKNKFINKLRLRIEKYIFKDICKFSGWIFYGGISNVASTQGINLLLNYAFGVIVNTAYGLTMQVQSAIRTFSLGFQVALNPQLIKTYSSGDIESHRNLIIRSAKISFFLVYIIALPIFFNLKSLLDIWLTQYPDSTIPFIKWSILTIIVITLTNPFAVSVEASGNIRKVTIYSSTCILLTIPVSWYLLKIINNPSIPFIVFFVGNCIIALIKIYFCDKVTDISLKTLLKDVFSPLTASGFCSFIFCWGLSHINPMSFIPVLLVMMGQVLCIMAFSYYIGLNVSERAMILRLLKKRFFSHNNANL